MSDLVPQDGGPEREHRRAQFPPAPRNGGPGQDWGPRDDGHPINDEIDLRDIFGVLRRRAGLVLSIAVLAVAAASILVWFDEPSYQSGTVLRMEDARRSLTGGLDGAIADRAMGRPDAILSQLEVLRSISVLGEVVDREALRFQPVTRGLTLADFHDVGVADAAVPKELHFDFGEAEYHVSGSDGRRRAAYGELVQLDGVRFAVPAPPGLEAGEVVIIPRQRAIEHLRGNMSAQLRRETDVIDVQYTARDPYTAERIANALAEVFRDHNARLARQEAERRRVFVEERLEQAGSMLSAVQSTLSEFRTREGVYSSREWFAAQQAGLLTLEMRREELDAARGMYRSILDGIETAELGEVGSRLEAIVASPEIAGNPVVGNLFEQLARYEMQRDSLTSGPWGASATNPDVVRLEQQIATTTDRLESAVRSHLRSVDARILALDDLRGRTEGEIAGLPTVEAEESRLVQQVQSISRTVDQLREEYQRSLIAEAVEVGQVEIVDWAYFPLQPLGGGRALKLVLGLMLGLMLGGGAAFLLESLDTKIHRREEMEDLLQLPSVGVVPRLPGRGGAMAAGVGRVRGLLGNRARNDAGNGVDDLITVSDARSPEAEAYRTIRTNLLFSEAVQSLRSLVVTSPTPTEGKSTSAGNLAVAFAQQGMKVLLVDCDLRKARLHKMFAVPREPGLTGLILGKASWEEVRHDTPVEGLDIVTSGALPPNPSELLGGARMRKALHLLKERYELVIFDTPPLVAGPDAAILSSYCDGVLLVIRAGSTEREAGRQAVRQLHTVGARILGAVLNDPDGELPKYSSYYAYQYQEYAES